MSGAIRDAPEGRQCWRRPMPRGRRAIEPNTNMNFTTGLATGKDQLELICQE